MSELDDRPEVGTVRLRELNEADLELLLAWRSNPQVYQYFSSQTGALVWADHFTWWCTRKHRKDWIILLSENNHERRVGSLNVSRLETGSPEIGLLIGETTLWGQGVASRALRFALTWLKGEKYESAQAKIHPKNVASVRLFEREGFHQNDDRLGFEGLFVRILR